MADGRVLGNGPPRLGRRELLAGAAALGVAPALAGIPARAAAQAGAPRPGGASVWAA